METISHPATGMMKTPSIYMTFQDIVWRFSFLEGGSRRGPDADIELELKLFPHFVSLLLIIRFKT